MFGFIEKAAKGAVKAVASVVKNPVGAVSSIANNPLVKAGAMVAAPLPVAAGLAVAASLAPKAAPKAAPGAVQAPAQAIGVPIPKGGDKWLPSASAAKTVVDKARKGDARALDVVRKTVDLAKAGDPGAKRMLALQKVAYQAPAFAQSGRVKVVNWWLYRDGSITRA